MQRARKSNSLYYFTCIIGDIFQSPELLIPGVADTTNLAPVYDLVGSTDTA